MNIFPPIPAWDAAHPIVVHFPIGLLLVAPVLVVLALLVKRHERGLWIGALAIMLLGVASAFVAVSTGEAGEDAAKGIAGADVVLDRHEDLAELARNLFAGLGAALAVIVVTRLVCKSPARRAFVVTGLVYLALHAAASLVLANAAHEGGRLVHEFGVRAPLAATTAAGATERVPMPGTSGEADD